MIEVLENFIKPIREKREEYAKDPKIVMEILKEGTERAREFARETMIEVKKAVKIDYY